MRKKNSAISKNSRSDLEGLTKSSQKAKFLVCLLAFCL